MSYDTKILLLTYAGAVILAAAYLYVRDLLYIKATGRPASERELDRIRERNRPLTRTRYVGWSVLAGSVILVEAYFAGWSGDYRGWRIIPPLGWMISGGIAFYDLQRRWWKQKTDSRGQPSGGPR